MINVDGRVWRQVKEPTSYVSQGLCSRLVVMCGKVIANDDCPWSQFCSKNSADVDTKCLTIHCAFDDPRRDQIVVHQACNERLRSPRTKRCIHFQALSPQAAPLVAGQIGFYGCLVNEDKLIRMRLHGRKIVSEPVMAALLHMGAQPFGGNQKLFLYVDRACAGTV